MGIDLKDRGDDDKVAVQVRSYGISLGDKSDKLKERAAELEPFNCTYFPGRQMFTVQKYVDKEPSILRWWVGAKRLSFFDLCCPHESVYEYRIRGRVDKIMVIGKERDERWVAS